ncbi:hypothetical protein J1779_11135 [Rahnella sp. FC061912-K]|uniref:hypothetical protein n=1 Tax=Rahnella rivi TaxID=2816249 RepID=UPI001C27A7D5|nr:hypothetical protein [Rahnella rivi]MBU9830492.1 hypothetical protein [Rahnella rivi]
MTAEIAVFNNSSIALAADSAVTTGINNKVKIYNSAEKLFELSKHHPVGAMIYNNATICSAPWELVIKSYRKQLKDTYFDHLDGYVNDFFTFLSTNKDIISDDIRNQALHFFYIGELQALIKETNDIDIVTFMQLHKVEPLFDVFYQYLSIRIDAKINILLSSDYLEGFSVLDENLIGDDIRADSENIAKIIVPNDPSTDFPQEILQKITKLFTLLTCKISDSNSFTGVVFAGYGENDYYPSVKTIHTYGIYNDRVLYYIDKSKTFENKMHQSGIIPFAQEEEVVSFIEGCNRSIASFTETLVSEVINRAKGFVDDEILAKLNDEELRKSIIDQSSTLWPQLSADFSHKRNNFVRENQVDKVTSMLDSLSKNDLAYMAESLVNITAFKRKVSNEHDTVGGPIDVAVISKGDGFIWVRRKHYFKSDLNHNFFSRNNTHN